LHTGNPGTGKTVLAASTVSELRSSVSIDNDEHNTVSYFFFDYSNPMQISRRSAYASLLAQVLHRYHENLEILDLFTIALANRREGQSTATVNELLDLLAWLSSRLNNWFVVIDAVDECDQPDSFLAGLVSPMACENARFLLFSRPNVGYLRRKAKMCTCITLTPDRMEADLRSYFTNQLEDMQDSDLIHESIDLDHLIQCLLKGADGMFEWARLMTAYLRSDALPPSARLGAILDLKTPERLEDMYLRILAMIASKLQVEQFFARRVFTWLAYGKRSLHETQLQDLLVTLGNEQSSSQKELKGTDSVDRFADFEHSLVMVCCSLVELRWSADFQAKICRFVHHSAFEFFRSKCSAPEAAYGSTVGTITFFHPARFEVEAELTTSCLRYHRLRNLKGPLSGNMFERASRHVLDKNLSFLQYAANFWAEHLAEIQASLAPVSRNLFDAYNELLKKLLRTLKTFLTSKFGLMTWVEVIYTYKGSHKTIHQKLLEWAEGAPKLSRGSSTQELENLSSLLRALVTDLHRMHELWGDTLQAAPNQLWNDVTAFTPSPFFAKTSAVTVKKLISESARLAELSSRPICQISRDLTGSDLLAILSIWPSRYIFPDVQLDLPNLSNRPFETAWQKQKSFRNEDLTKGICEGWNAQYQLWDIQPDEPCVKVQWHLPLNAGEVSLQVALFQKHVRTRVGGKDSVATRREIALHFPTSIGEGLDKFTVLRTVFTHDRRKPLTCSASPHSESPWIRASIPVVHNLGTTSLRGMSLKAREVSQDDITTGSSSMAQLDTVLTINRTPAFVVQTCKRYVLYKSVEGWDTASGEEPAASMALFRMPRDSQQEIDLLAFIDCLEHRWPFSNCIFHPDLPLVAFCCNSIIDGPRIALWCFTTEAMRRRQGFSYITEVSLRKDSELISIISLAYGVPKKLQFSPNGEELIIQLPGGHLPKVVQLTATLAYKAAVAEEAHLERSDGREESLTVTTTASPGKLQLIKTGTPAALQHNEIVMHDDGSSTQFAFRRGVAGRNLHLVHRTDGVVESQALLSLPAYDDINHVDVSVQLPTTTREDKITIILNKTAQPYYTLSKLADEAAPSVIRKDIRAVAPSRKRLLYSVSPEYGTPVYAPDYRPGLKDEQVQDISGYSATEKSDIKAEDQDTAERKRPRLDEFDFDKLLERHSDEELDDLFLG
jgi:hypothetical protein